MDTTTTNYTPGPWTPQEDGLIVGPNQEGIADWMFTEPYIETGYHTRKANARLIAAAPELLNALRYLYAMSNRLYQGDTEEGRANCRAIESARLALTKAEGL